MDDFPDTVAGEPGNHENSKGRNPERHGKARLFPGQGLLFFRAFGVLRVFVIRSLVETTSNPSLLLQSKKMVGLATLVPSSFSETDTRPAGAGIAISR